MEQTNVEPKKKAMKIYFDHQISQNETSELIQYEPSRSSRTKRKKQKTVVRKSVLVILTTNKHKLTTNKSPFTVRILNADIACVIVETAKNASKLQNLQFFSDD